MSRAVARAHPNIALIKYWGKQDERLSLPATGSLSMTLDIFPTTTAVELDPRADADTLQLGGAIAGGVPLERVSRFLDLVRERAGIRTPARVISHNTVPTGAGLASSASGFAALAAAAAAAYGLSLSSAELSRLARRGSGSAARSVIPGVAVWHAGDDANSFAQSVPAPAFSMVVATVDAQQKVVSSREAMRRSVQTSPFYPAWVTSTAASLQDMLAACRAGDFTRIGELTESNALRMHATIQASWPPVRYLGAASIAIFDRVAALRAEGVETYATADAGPNVVAIARPADAAAVADALRPLAAVQVAQAGPGVRLLGDDEAAA